MKVKFKRRSVDLHNLSSVWPKELFKTALLINNGSWYGFALGYVTVRYFSDCMRVYLFDDSGRSSQKSMGLPMSKEDLIKKLCEAAGESRIKPQLWTA